MTTSIANNASSSSTPSYASFEAMVAAQKQERREARLAARAAWVANMEASIADAIPIRPRLVSLLNEARRHERLRAENLYAAHSSHQLFGVLHPIRQSHLAHIDKGYRNLILDVTKRCEGIVKTNAPPANIWNIGSEAIGCFSTMLPWSDGVANRDVSDAPAAPLPVSPIAAVGTSGAFRGGRPPQMTASRVVGGVMGMPTIRIQHRDPVQVTVPRWTVPTRLNMDNRKLAAAVASRRRELQRMKGTSCGAQLQSNKNWSASTDRRGATSVTVA